jgi:hypothetical protein
MSRRVWQIAAGDFGRDYSWLFLKHDLMFQGPGRFGAYDHEHYRRLVSLGEETAFTVGCIRRFCHDVQPGDIVLLRRGYRVSAVGLVPEEGYEHRAAFDDVYGWNLEHTRRVVWQEQLTEELLSLQQTASDYLFAAYKQIPTFTQVQDSAVLERLATLEHRCVQRKLKGLPEPLPSPLTLDQLGQELFARGLANASVEQVQRAIERQRRLLGWYRQHGKASARPDEHEVVAHMVLPLLLALGWSEQLLAVEWYKVDLAGFWGTPTTASNCVLVCEAKRLNQGLQNVLKQAERYVRDLHLDRCGKILLTQGGRFYLYSRNPDHSWPQEPSGYLNVERIRTNHIAPANTDAVKTLMSLTPAGVLGEGSPIAA